MKLRIVALAAIVVIAVGAYYATMLGDTDVAEPALVYPVMALGEDTAPITIEEWGDYQCEFCMRFHGSTLEVIKERFIDTGRARLVFMDFPLNGPNSVVAASASHCAADQGAYWEYHDELYNNWAGENTGWINSGTLVRFAGNVGIDTEEFSECLGSSKHHDRVLETYRHGQSKGIDSTPSFLISNGDKVFKIRGNQPLDVFLRVFDEL